jgi:hypothetical protein
MQRDQIDYDVTDYLSRADIIATKILNNHVSNEPSDSDDSEDLEESSFIKKRVPIRRSVNLDIQPVRSKRGVEIPTLDLGPYESPVTPPSTSPYFNEPPKITRKTPSNPKTCAFTSDEMEIGAINEFTEDDALRYNEIVETFRNTISLHQTAILGLLSKVNNSKAIRLLSGMANSVRWDPEKNILILNSVNYTANAMSAISTTVIDRESEFLSKIREFKDIMKDDKLEELLSEIETHLRNKNNAEYIDRLGYFNLKCQSYAKLISEIDIDENLQEIKVLDKFLLITDRVNDSVEYGMKLRTPFNLNFVLDYGLSSPYIEYFKAFVEFEHTKPNESVTFLQMKEKYKKDTLAVLQNRITKISKISNETSEFIFTPITQTEMIQNRNKIASILKFVDSNENDIILKNLIKPNKPNTKGNTFSELNLSRFMKQYSKSIE